VYEVLIQKSHTNIIYFKHNNKKIDINTLRKEFDKEFDDLNYIKNFKNFKLNDIIKMIDNMDTEDIKKLEHSIELNLNIAEYGISKLVNYTNKKIFPDCYKCETKNFDKIFEISRKVFAAIYTRMSGEKIPVMSSGGSGNAGITITLPLVIYAENNNIPENKKIKSLALAHIINSWIRCYIGRIGGLCGGVIAAGAGVSAGITYQMEGSVEQIKKSILNCLNSTAGIICDGAKNSCAFKISNFVYTFFQSAFFAKNGIGVNLNEGIIGEDLIETFRNMELLSNNINNDIDHTIINIINKRNHNFKIH
jgi:L-cysteine desulfidase